MPCDAQKTLTAAELVLIEETRQVLAGGTELKLTPCEYNLLKTLLSRPDRIFSRNELINVVQGYDFEGYDRTIDSHVKNLRKKIAKCLPDKEIISTIYGVGYKLNSRPDRPVGQEDESSPGPSSLDWTFRDRLSKEP